MAIALGPAIRVGMTRAADAADIPEPVSTGPSSP
jgi:hypothetical protein